MASEQDIFCETQLAVIIDDLARNFDNNLQTDIAILDFLKAFDTVPHNKLLHKLEAYGIRGTLYQWIKSFLCIHVVSGVPQGTVLGPFSFFAT